MNEIRVSSWHELHERLYGGSWNRTLGRFRFSDPRAHLEEWLDEHPDTAQRLVIPAALKWELRDKLDQANITERVLYPGLDGLARWLRRYYLPLER